MHEFIAITYFVTAVGFILITRALNRRPFTKNLFNPIIIFGVAYALVYLAIPGLQIYRQQYQYSAEYSPDALLASLFCFIAFGLMVFSTYAIFHGTDVFQRSRFLQVGEWHPLSRRFLLVSALLLVLPFMASFFFQYQRISDIGYLIAIADRSNLGSGSGYQLMPLPWLSLFTYLLFMEKLRARKCRENKLQYSLPAIAVLVIISSIAGFIIGSRSQGLIPFFILMLLYYAASEAGRFRLRPKHLTIVALILAILVSGSALQSVRDQVMGSEAAPEMIEVGVSDIYEGAVGYLGTAENMFWMIEHWNAWELQFGRTFAAAFVGWIPRAIWPGKPLGGGPVLRNLIHPGSYDLSTGEYLTSYTTGLPAEAVMNFGLGGLLFVPFIYGFALFGIAKLSLKVRTSLHFVTWMLALFLVAYGYLTGEFFATCSWLVAYIFPLLLLIGMYRHSWKIIYRTCSDGTML